MVYKIIVLPIAEQELDEAIDFYESRKKGLGNIFLFEINSVYDTLLKNPFIYRKNPHGYREAFLKIFPFLIVFEIKDNIIYIDSFFHTSRNPKNKPQ